MVKVKKKRRQKEKKEQKKKKKKGAARRRSKRRTRTRIQHKNRRGDVAGAHWRAGGVQRAVQRTQQLF